MNKYGFLYPSSRRHFAVQPAPSSRRGRNRDFGLYDELNNKPQRILENKKDTKREKLEALVKHYEGPNAQKPSKALLKKMRRVDMTRVNAKGLNLRVLGEDVVRSINWAGADLSGQNFEGFNLRGIRMRGAKPPAKMGRNAENADLGFVKGLSGSGLNAIGAEVDGTLVITGNTALQGVRGEKNMSTAGGDAFFIDGGARRNHSPLAALNRETTKNFLERASLENATSPKPSFSGRSRKAQLSLGL